MFLTPFLSGLSLQNVTLGASSVLSTGFPKLKEEFGDGVDGKIFEI